MKFIFLIKKIVVSAWKFLFKENGKSKKPILLCLGHNYFWHPIESKCFKALTKEKAKVSSANPKEHHNNIVCRVRYHIHHSMPSKHISLHLENIYICSLFYGFYRE